MYISFRSHNFYTLFELYGHMYCYYNVLPEVFLLFTGKQHCLHNFLGWTYLSPISLFMQNFKFGGFTVLAVQLFNKIKKYLKKHVSLYFPHVMLIIIHLFGLNLFFFCML